EGPTKSWERAHWIDGERLERDLSGLLEHSSYHDSPDTSRAMVAEAVARRDGEFVALVDQDERFLKLIDRRAILDQLGKAQAPKLNADGHSERKRPGGEQ